MNEPLDAQARLKIEAALDGELDAANALAFEREMAEDSDLREAYERQSAARDEVRAFAPKESAPDALRARVLALVEEPVSTAPRKRFVMQPPLALAAALAAIAFLGSLTWTLRGTSPGEPPETLALVSGYMRGQVSGQPFDVASSDRHTVKPWLASRVTLGAAVVDLAPAGYPLAGGRIDIIGATPVPTLVYRRREHFISVSELPVGHGAASWEGSVEGFHVERWIDAERAYVAISDLDAADLADFARAFHDAQRPAAAPAKP